MSGTAGDKDMTEPKENSAGPEKKNSRGGRKLALLFLLLLLVVVLVYGALMIKHRLDYAVTDAVFVDSDRIINISFERVGGRLVEMAKIEGDTVTAGELLAEVRPKDFQLEVDQLKEKVKALRHQRQQQETALRKATVQVELKIGMARDRVAGTSRKIAALEDQIAALRVSIGQLARDEQRYRELYRQKVVAKRAYETIETQLQARKKELAAQEKNLAGLRSRLRAAQKEVRLAESERLTIDEIRQGIAATDAKIKSLEAKLSSVGNQLSYCRLTSPITGKVAKKYHSVGDVVGTGMPVYALVDPRDIYVLVLLGEKKLAGVEPGCPAAITIDAYPDLEYKGEVEAILPTSAAKFALVPRDISAGEFTKVVQRIPVKVKITDGDLSRLVIGMGGEIEIERRR
ncbi:MAG: efflux RND transporter periplasmic adaptor subunit [Deltaproteobacteria bacterium]|nr:efflux RND transporter periplasmic adaptor subunit [Deltaproteobacteria bacterium]